ncbi:MAG TPA: DEAD/DEAH box helicase, partial [Solirubrobacteraceae bacterium]|nr:DEAD/DEAH box helicase [Solirubrobacteraceae bacterium]
MIAKVEPLTTARSLRGPFDYLLGAGLAGVGVGSMLVVPFANRRLLGVVVEVAEDSDLPPERLAEPLTALEADVPAELVRLGLWVAKEYVSTPARGLALVLPPGTGTGSGRRLAARRSLAAALTDAGRAALEGDGRLSGRQSAALAALRDGPRRVSMLTKHSGCDHAGMRRLERRGLVTLDQTPEPPRRPIVGDVGARPAVTELTSEQTAAVARIVARISTSVQCSPEGAPGCAPPADAPATDGEGLLLHGVTGSGKTEVYLRTVAAALERGRSAIVLVPEIALTPQTAGRFVERFGDVVAVLHSRLTARERYDEWARLRSGAARVCVGPRSAIFAPLSDVGLIVVDEEHDASYKQEGDPRY